MGSEQDGRYKLIRGKGRIGVGSWKYWTLGMESIYEAAEEWETALHGIVYPWLCWDIDDRWCALQQKLVLEAGWTPVVGCDTNVKNPTVLPGSVYVDFNKHLKLPLMYMHFPLEWVYLYTKRLAFWHSDFLASIDDMHKYANIFKSLKDGEIAATWTLRGTWGFKWRKNNRIFELIGCTTAGASKQQYEMGCGWWMDVNYHPNYKHKKSGKIPYYDHGTGVTIWHKKFGGKLIALDPDEKNGHASLYMLKNKKIRKLDHRSKTVDMNEFFSLEKIAKNLGIDHLL
jgi:hypothetical protein